MMKSQIISTTPELATVRAPFSKKSRMSADDCLVIGSYYCVVQGRLQNSAALPWYDRPIVDALQKILMSALQSPIHETYWIISVA